MREAQEWLRCRRASRVAWARLAGVELEGGWKPVAEVVSNGACPGCGGTDQRGLYRLQDPGGTTQDLCGNCISASGGQKARRAVLSYWRSCGRRIRAAPRWVDFLATARCWAACHGSWEGVAFSGNYALRRVRRAAEAVARRGSVSLGTAAAVAGIASGARDSEYEADLLDAAEFCKAPHELPVERAAARLGRPEVSRRLSPKDLGLVATARWRAQRGLPTVGWRAERLMEAQVELPPGLRPPLMPPTARRSRALPTRYRRG